MRFERMKDQEWTLLPLPLQNVPLEMAEHARTVRELLGVKPGLHDLCIAYGSRWKSEEDVTMIACPMLEVFTDIASTIDVPVSHARGRKFRTLVLLSKNRSIRDCCPP